jgi:hypothetical protein
MRAFRENIVPVAFLTLWVAASGYTVHKLEGVRALRVIEATMDMTVTAPMRSTSHVTCAQETALTPGT